jgi:hypothetical protein
MNKYSLGTIVGAALLGVSKKLGSKSEAISIGKRTVYSIVEGGFFNVTLKTALPIGALDHQTLRNIDTAIHDRWADFESAGLSQLFPNASMDDITINLELNHVFAGAENDKVWEIQFTSFFTFKYPDLGDIDSSNHSPKASALHLEEYHNKWELLEKFEKPIMLIISSFMESIRDILNEYFALPNLDFNIYKGEYDGDTWTHVATEYYFIDKDGNEVIPPPENLMKLRDR